MYKKQTDVYILPCDTLIYQKREVEKGEGV